MLVQFYRNVALNSMVSNLIKSAHEVTLVAHKDPDQVFLADVSGARPATFCCFQLNPDCLHCQLTSDSVYIDRTGSH